MSSCKILYIDVGVRGGVEGLLNRLACHWLVWEGLTATRLAVIYYYVWSSHYFYQYAYGICVRCRPVGSSDASVEILPGVCLAHSFS